VPGFLSEYDETTTLKFGKDEEWWIKVRRFLTRAEFKKAQAALVQPIMRSVGEETETTGDVDTVGYQNELVIAAITEWNLSDRDGNVLPLEPDTAKRASVDLLPQEVFEIVSKAIEGVVKKEDKKDEAKKDDPFRGHRAPRALPRGRTAIGAG
jgi:hypothetical protein